MSLDPNTSANRFFSMLVTLLAVVAFGFIAWKAFDVWRSDPAVDGIQQILEQQK